MGRLNALQIKSIKKPGKHSDGNGLYLAISKTQARSWIFRYMLYGKRREMGLGSLDVVSLSEARDRATKCRKLMESGFDPIKQRDDERLELQIKSSMSKAFKACALEYIDLQKKSWTDQKRQVREWTNSLENHAFKTLGHIPVSMITTEMVVNALRPIWYDKCETATRVLNRISRILGYAKAMKYRSGENPARWEDTIDQIFPPKSEIAPVQHMPSMSREELPDFFALIHGSDDIALKALEFKILTTLRTQAVALAEWTQFDLQARVWEIPAQIMKMKRPHFVPLTDRMIEILLFMKKISMNQYVFPGRFYGRHMCKESMRIAMRRLGRKEVPHGFRATFSTWVAECTSYPKDIREMALAHAIEDDTEASYQRGDMLEKRRPLMEDWGNFCASKVSASKSDLQSTQEPHHAATQNT